MINRIPPPILTAMACALIWGASMNWPATTFRSYVLMICAILCVTAGLVMLLWAGVLFKRTKTTVNPFRPNKTNAIVADGPYKISRNPMYLGMGFIIIGAGLHFGSLVAIPIFIVFKLYMDAAQIKPEERALTEKFGANYIEYMSKVRRWL